LLLHHKFQNNRSGYRITRTYRQWRVSHIWLALYAYDKIKTHTLRSWFHLLQGFTQIHMNAVHYKYIRPMM